MSAIAVQLGHLRVARGLTQQQLAERTGLRRDTISALERGKSQGIEFDTLARLCDALGCLPNELLELGATSHVAPILGGEDEDEIIAERLAEVDLAALAADPSIAARALWDYEEEAQKFADRATSPLVPDNGLDQGGIVIAVYDHTGQLLGRFHADGSGMTAVGNGPTPGILVAQRS